MAEVVLENICKTYGNNFHAIDQLNLSVEDGEFLILVGPSGCGKSTALNCLAGLLTLTSGSIWLDSARIDRLKPEERGFGMVFQNYALFPHMSVRRNVGFGLVMRGWPRPRSTARSARRSRSCGSATRATNFPGSSPAVSSSGWRLRAHWLCTHSCCCLMSR